MRTKQLYLEVKILDKKYKKLKNKLKKSSILNTRKNNYLKSDKESFKLLWLEYIEFFTYIQKLVKKSWCRKYYIFFDYNKVVLKKYFLTYYFNVIIDLEKNIWEHMEFIRTYLKENFKKDYWYFIKFIYKPDYINLINTPNVFFKAFKQKIERKVYNLIDKAYLDTKYLNRLKIDYTNFFYHFKKYFDKILFFVAKKVWLMISHIRFSSRKKWIISQKNLKKYLKVAKSWDILLTRWNWNASNLSIPWFWKHMSMYLWSWKILKKHFTYSFIKKLKDDKHYIIEATGEWVKIVTIDNLILHNDYLWAIRTNFKKEKILRVIDNSFSNIWKSYDFWFDFYSDNNLVCSELVMKSYAKEYSNDEWIEIKLEDIWLSLAFPPNNLVNLLYLYKNQRKPKIFPIFFIDSLEKWLVNFISTNEEFFKTRKRPRTTFFLK